MKKSESIVKIAKAMAEFRKNVQQPKKDANNPFFKSKYTTLDAVVESIDTTASKHGLSFIQYPVNDEHGNTGIATIVLHESGEFLEFEPSFMKPEKNTPQAIGSVLTYLRRYTLSAVFGIASEEDDDGNHASGSYNKQPKKQPQDKGKVALVQQNAKDFSEVLKTSGQELSQQDVLNVYLGQYGLKNISQASNEQLIGMSQSIKKKIDEYKKKQSEQTDLPEEKSEDKK